jgi:hypothetical protein
MGPVGTALTRAKGAMNPTDMVLNKKKIRGKLLIGASKHQTTRNPCLLPGNLCSYLLAGDPALGER